MKGFCEKIFFRVFLAAILSGVFGSCVILADSGVFDGAGVACGIFWTIDMRPSSAKTAGTGSCSLFSGGERNRDFENNPAVLSVPPCQRGVDFAITRWFDNLYFNSVFVSIPSPAILSSSSFGFSFKRFATEDYLTDARGFGTDKFQYEDISFGCAFAFNFDRGKYAGVGIRYMTEKIYSLSGSGLAFDWGVAAKISNVFSAGASLLNFPGFIKYNSPDDYEGYLKSNLKLSLACEPFPISRIRPKFFADVNNYFVRASSVLFERELALGFEVEPYDFVNIGAGVRGLPSKSDLSNLKFSFGIGFLLHDGRYRIDYAGEILPLGDVHRCGVSVRF